MMWVSRTTNSSSVGLGIKPLQSLCSLAKHVSPETVPTSADSNYKSIVLRASKDTTVVMKQSPMWDWQNVCTDWWLCTSKHSGLHYPVEAYIEVEGWNIIPSFQGMLTATNMTGECALGSYMRIDEHHHLRSHFEVNAVWRIWWGARTWD
jgi:hypothetical protein